MHWLRLALVGILCGLTGCLATKKPVTTGDAVPLDSIEELMQITSSPNNETDPELSPDGKKMVFVADKAGSQDIFISDIFGKNPRQLTFNTAQDSNPAWTPDGKSVIFDSNRLGYSAIFKKELIRERITGTLVARGTNDFAPDIARSQSFLVFGNLVANRESLWILRISKGRLSQIGDGLNPVLSPDDTSIVYVSSRGGNSDIWITDPKAEEVVQLTVDSAEDVDPAWSPDGKKIVFSSNRTGNYDIWMLDLQKNRMIQLTNNAADDGHPVWTPDGRFIYFHSTRSGNFDIWRIKPVLSK